MYSLVSCCCYSCIFILIFVPELLCPSKLFEHRSFCWDLFSLNYSVSIFSIVLAHSKQEAMTSSEQNPFILVSHKSQTKLFLG